MFLSILKYVRGYVKVSLQGYAPERFLNLCSNHNILIWDLIPTEDGYRFCISIDGFRKLHPILRKTKTRIRIEKRVGLPFQLFRYRKRKIFAAGMLLFAGLLYWLSGYIWKIEVEGNSYLSEEVILEFLQRENSTFGDRINKIDCAALEEELRSTYGEVIWASIQIYGTKMTVSIQENLLPEESYEAKTDEISDIVATKAGTITDIITRSGTPLVKAGDVVEAGTVLVSGRIEIFNDAGEIAQYQYQTADADITADVLYAYEDTIPFLYEQQVYTGEQKMQYQLRVGKLLFSQPFFYSDYEEETVVTDTRQLRVAKNFYLPVYWEQNLYMEYETVEKEYTKTQVKELAKKHLNTYISNLQEKGVQIIEKNVMIDKEMNSYRVLGTIKANESIVSYSPTEILEITREEGQLNDESD